MKNVLWVIAAVLVVLGGLFTLQGLGIVGGSGMTGDRTWAVILGGCTLVLCWYFA